MPLARLSVCPLSRGSGQGRYAGWTGEPGQAKKVAHDTEWHGSREVPFSNDLSRSVRESVAGMRCMCLIWRENSLTSA